MKSNFVDIANLTIPDKFLGIWQEIVDTLAKMLNVPVALIMEVEYPNIKVLKSSKSEGNPYKEGDAEHLAGLYCESVIQSGKKLIVPNALKDPLWEDNPDIKLNMISYMGYPIFYPTGEAFGTVCVLDSKENSYNELYDNFLRSYRDLIEAHLENIYRTMIDLKVKDEQINEKQDQIQDLLSNVDAIILEGDPFRFDVLHGRVEEILGYTFEEWKQHPEGPGGMWYNLLHPEDRHLAKFCSDEIKQCRDHTFEYRLKHKDGSYHWFYDTVTVEAHNNIPTKTRSIAVDITQLKLMEERLRYSEARYRQLFELSPMGIAVVNLETGSYEAINEAAAKAWAGEIGDFMGKTVFDFTPPEVHEKMKRRIEKLSHGKTAGLTENKGIRIDGTPIIMSMISARIEFDGKPCTLSMFNDITEHKKTETKYQDLVESSQDLIFRCDPDGRFIFLNQAWENLLGYKIDEMIGRKFTEFKEPETAEESLKAFRKIIDDKIIIKGYETQYTTNDGNVVTLIFNVIPLEDVTGKVIGTQGTALDITQLKIIETQLRNSEEKYRRLFELSPMPIVIIQLSDGLYLELNDAALNSLQCTKEEMKDKTVFDLVIPEKHTEMIERIRTLSADRYPKMMENILRRPNGTIMEIEIVSTKITFNDKPCALAMYHDISERKKMEKKMKETQELLFQAQKMDAIGRLTSGVAHDFNNLLTIISGSTELILTTINDNPNHICPVQEEIQTIMLTTKNATELVKQLLSFSKKHDLKAEKINLNHVIKTLNPMVKRLLSKTIDLSIDLEENLPFIKVDPSHISQVIVNLITNANDAMPVGGSLELCTKSENDQVIFTIRDTGTGMDETTKERLFEPYFTTKGDKGHGLGLAIVYGVISQSNGYIELESEIGKGTTFRIYLPVYS